MACGIYSQITQTNREIQIESRRGSISFDDYIIAIFDVLHHVIGLAMECIVIPCGSYLKVPAVADAYIGCQGTVNHLIAKDNVDQRTYFEYYNFAKNKLDIYDGSVKTEEQYYSKTAAA